MSPVAQGIRHIVRDAAVLELFCGQVAQPLEGEARDVVEEGRGRDEELPVAGPACPLALRAVGGDLARVVAERPLRDVVQRVDPLVAAAEPPGAPEVGVHHHPGDVVGRERPGVALDAGELEPVGGVSRLEHLARRAGRDHVVGHAHRLRCPGEVESRIEVVLRHVTGGVDHLAVHHGQLGPLRSEISQSQPAVDVLAQVDHVAVRRQTGDRDGPQLLHPAGRRCRRACQVGVAVVGDRDGHPSAGLGPVVLVLARHEVGPAERPGRRLPSLARRDDGAVRMQLPEEGQGRPVAVGGLEEARAAAPPPVAEHDLPSVLALDQQVTHVVGLHVQGGRVAGEAGGQLDVADAAPVEKGLVDPVRGGVEARAGGRSLESEAPAQDVCGPLGLVRFDPARHPVGCLQQTRLEPGRLRPRALAGVGPDLHPPLHPVARRHGLAGPGDERRGFGVRAAGVLSIELDRVGDLSAGAVGESPGQPRSGIPQAEDGVAAVLGPEVGGCGHVAPSRLFSRLLVVARGCAASLRSGTRPAFSAKLCSNAPVAARPSFAAAPCSHYGAGLHLTTWPRRDQCHDKKHEIKKHEITKHEIRNEIRGGRWPTSKPCWGRSRSRRRRR